MTRSNIRAKKLAQELYNRGLLLTEITSHPDILKINNNKPLAKSSVYLYTKEIILSEELVLLKKEKQNTARRKNGKKGREATALKAENLRRSFRDEGSKRFLESEHFRLLCAIYWGEGYKEKTRCGITNSDPDLLYFLTAWLDNNRIPWVFKVHYYEENGFTENAIKAHWMACIPNLDNSKFRKFYKKPPYKRKSNLYSIKSVKKHPYGLGAVIANSVYARQLIEGGIQELKNRLYNL